VTDVMSSLTASEALDTLETSRVVESILTFLLSPFPSSGEVRLTIFIPDPVTDWERLQAFWALARVVTTVTGRETMRGVLSRESLTFGPSPRYIGVVSQGRAGRATVDDR